VAITFGLTLLPITLAVGAAVDYSFANRTKAVLDSYADAAALAAANQSAMALSASTARTNAVKFFKAQAASLKRGSLGKVSAKVTDSGNGRTVVVSYTATVPTAFMGLANISTIDIAGSSTAASASRPTSISIYCSTTPRPWASARHRPTWPPWSTTHPINAPSRAMICQRRRTTITALQKVLA